jgi:glutathione S-transferase
MEGSAILSYLTRNFDPEKKFTFTEDPELSQIEQWTAFLQSGVGPMQGQANQYVLNIVTVIQAVN